MNKVSGMLLLLVLTGVAAPAFGWGQTGHRRVNALALEALRTDAAANRPGARTAYQLLNSHAFLFVTEADLADVARVSDTTLEGDHYLDLEDFGGPAFTRALPAARPADVPDTAGRLPWIVGKYAGQLRTALRAGRTAEALRAAVFLSHFVGDAHVPLHATRDYNGRTRTSKGIHSRWESDLVEAMDGLDAITVSTERDWGQTTTPLPPAALQRIAELATARALENSFLLVDGVYMADGLARKAAGWQNRVPAKWSADDSDGKIYLRKMERWQGETVRSRLAEAARFLADLVSAAAAGSRALPPVRLDELRLDEQAAEADTNEVRITLTLTRLAGNGTPGRAWAVQARDAARPAAPAIVAPAVTPPAVASETAAIVVTIPVAALEGIDRLELRLTPDDQVTPDDNRVYVRRRAWLAP